MSTFQANWRWLCDGEHGIGKDDRQHLMRMFKKLIYAKTRKEFEEKQEEFGECAVCAKYPQYQGHIEQSYGGRVEAWALFMGAIPMHMRKYL
jgi:hypothetical protein